MLEKDELRDRCAFKVPGAELAELGFMGILSRPLLLFSLPGIPTLLGLVLFCIKRADRGLVLLDESPSNKLEALQPEKEAKKYFPAKFSVENKT